MLEDESESIDIRVGAAFALSGMPAKKALPALERVRAKCLGVPEEDAANKVFLTRIREAIAAIHRAEPQLPTNPGDAGKARR